jgi:YopX protein
MREHLFRGKLKTNGEWVYGSLINSLFVNAEDKTPVCYIVPDPKLNLNVPYYDCWEDIVEWIHEYEVIPETVGWYLGITDLIGNMIFESDILVGKFGTGIGGKSTRYKDMRYSVRFHSTESEFFIDMPNGYGNYRFCPKLSQSSVIGNLHDHPELLK